MPRSMPRFITRATMPRFTTRAPMPRLTARFTALFNRVIAPPMTFGNMAKMMAKIIIGMIIGAMIIGPAPAWAARPDWPNTSFSYYANDENLAEVIRNFANSVNTPLYLSPRVKGSVNGAYFAANAEDFLNKISEDFNLLWYYDGITLYVYGAGEKMTRSFPSRTGDDTAALIDKIERDPIYESRFGMTLGKDGKTVVVSGPPRYVELLAASVKAPGLDDPVTSRVFYLKHAWASDKTFYYRKRKYTVEGVATLLRKLFSGETGRNNASSTGEQNATEPDGVPPAAGVLSEGAARRGDRQDASGNRAKPQLVGRSKVSLATYITSFQADERLNAVMVHDFESRMPMYESLVEKLDRETGLIEIKAAILDVDSSKVEELGINWRLNRGKISAGYGAFSNTAFDAGEAIALNDAIDGFSTVLPFGANYIASRIQALEKTGSARVLARPSILTLDNMQAMLDLHQTFHVKVAGQYEVNLFPVTTGTLLRVTPHIVDDTKTTKDNPKPSGRRGITLAVSIEDGAFTQQTVDELPVVKKNTINTQAFIKENESLLIGGYHYEEDQSSKSKVPLLGDIPLLGLFFSATSDEKTKNERIYIITPKVIPYSQLSSAVPPS